MSQQKNKKIVAAAMEGIHTIRGPLLGPRVKLDKEPVPTMIPAGVVIPDNLEFVTFEYDFPVGFRRLRHALLHNKSFDEQVIKIDTLKQAEIEYGEWDHHNGVIGLHETPKEYDEKDFIGAKLSCQYLLPGSIFIKASTAYDNVELIAYNDYCFAKRQETKTPGVPYGKTFVSKSQMVVINTGNDSCRMISSVECEFPKGPPVSLVKRQIVNGLKAATKETMITIAGVICRYANEFPLEDDGGGQE